MGCGETGRHDDWTLDEGRPVDGVPRLLPSVNGSHNSRGTSMRTVVISVIHTVHIYLYTDVTSTC